MEEKRCVTCKEIKPVSEFGKYKDGYQKQCKKCAREYYLRNKNKKKEKTQVTTYLDETELEILDKRVSADKSNRSDFIKKIILEKTAKPIININFDSLDNVAYEINKIGVNINQIAYRVNKEHQLYKSDMKYIKEQQEHIENILCDYYDVVLALQEKANK